MITPDQARENLYVLNNTIDKLTGLIGHPSTKDNTLLSSVIGATLNAINENVQALRTKTPQVRVSDGMPRVSVGDPQPLPPGGQIVGSAQAEVKLSGTAGE